MIFKKMPARSGHLNKEAEVIDIAKVTDADRLVVWLTVIHKQ